jgi:hypothetical protein
VTNRAIATVIALLLAGCGATSHPRAAAAGCAPAAIHNGPPPAWTAAAWSDSSPGFRVPYALSSNGAAGAFFFAFPRAGNASNPSNKVLWIVRYPRNHNPLLITARYGSDAREVVRITRPADSSPGEIYPSSVDLPKPGCWRLALAWGPHRATIDIDVRPARGS